MPSPQTIEKINPLTRIEISPKVYKTNAAFSDYSGLELTSFDVETLGDSADPKEVQYLYLSDNRLTELEDRFFSRFPSLKWLDLRNNRLSTIPMDTRCLNLETLLINGNPEFDIEELKKSIIQHFPNMSTLQYDKAFTGKFSPSLSSEDRGNYNSDEDDSGFHSNEGRPSPISADDENSSDSSSSICIKTSGVRKISVAPKNGLRASVKKNPHRERSCEGSSSFDEYSGPTKWECANGPSLALIKLKTERERLRKIEQTLNNRIEKQIQAVKDNEFRKAWRLQRNKEPANPDYILHPPYGRDRDTRIEGGYLIKVTPHGIPTPHSEKLRACVERRENIVDQMSQEISRVLSRDTNSELSKSQEEMRRLRSEIKKIDIKIKQNFFYSNP